MTEVILVGPGRGGLPICEGSQGEGGELRQERNLVSAQEAILRPEKELAHCLPGQQGR